jgi:hypothetical protein
MHLESVGSRSSSIVKICRALVLNRIIVVWVGSSKEEEGAVVLHS